MAPCRPPPEAPHSRLVNHANSIPGFFQIFGPHVVIAAKPLHPRFWRKDGAVPALACGDARVISADARSPAVSRLPPIAHAVDEVPEERCPQQASHLVASP
jgi:hypothetical protein